MPKSFSSPRKVVFFFPSFASSEATAPLGVLAVATPLIRAGYQIVLIDSTITPDYKKRVLEEVRDAVCLGISLVTGPMIRETVEIARAVKEWNPDFPIILGGWHPSLLPGQTLQAECVDYIVRGQGEDALLELVKHLETRSAPDLIPGIGFKRGGKLILTPERPLKPLVDMPPKAYHIADFDAYERGCGKRWAMYTSSLACPFNCAYCTNAGVYGRKWNALPPEQFVEETVDLTQTLSPRNALGGRRQLSWSIWTVHAASRKGWCAQARNSSGAYRRRPIWSRGSTPEDLKLLRRAGLHQVCQGVDSGSPKILQLMNKTFQDFDQIYESAARCLAADIRPSFNIIFAFPGEGAKERRETVELHDGRLPAFPGSGILDQHLHALSRLSDHGASQGDLASKPPATLEGLGRLLSALHRTSVAARDATTNGFRSRANIFASPLTEFPSRLILAARLRESRRRPSPCRRAGVSTTMSTSFPSRYG